MTDEFKIEIKVLSQELKQAMGEIQKLSDAIDKLKTSKPSPATSSYFQKYNDIQKNASILTTKLGRDLDALTKQYGIASTQVNNFVQSQLKEDRVARTLTIAQRQLDKALKDGSITRAKYALEMQRMANMQQLFRNKMNMATPIRQMQTNLSSITSLLSAINPQVGSAIGSITSRFAGMNIPELKNFKWGENFNAEIAKSTPLVDNLAMSFSKLASTTGLVVAGASAIALTLGGVFATNAIKTGAKFEDMEYQMMALINSTTKFKDNATGNFVSFEKNMEISLSNAKEMINQFVKDAPRLAGTNLEELTQTASVTLGKLGSAGITDPKQQARLIESMTIAIKTVTKGQQNAGTQLASESRALIEGEFKANQTLINQLATQMGGKEAFKDAMEKAKKEGKFGEFLEEQLKPYIRAANFAAGSLSNLGEIIQDFFTMFNKTVAESGLFEAFKKLTQEALKPFIEMVDPDKFGSIKQGVLDFAKSFGVSLTNLLNALAPLIPVITQAGISFMQFLKVAIDFSVPFINAFTNVIKVISDLFQIFQPAIISATIGYFTAIIANQTIVAVKALADVITTQAIPALTKFFTGIFTGTTLATGGLTLIVPIILGIAVAFIALASQVKISTEEISKNLEDTFSDKLSSQLGEERNKVLNILQDLKNNTAITAEEMIVIWEKGMKGTKEANKFYLDGMFKDFLGTFSLIGSEIKLFFQNLWSYIINGSKIAAGSLLEETGKGINSFAQKQGGLIGQIAKSGGSIFSSLGKSLTGQGMKGIEESKFDQAITKTEITDKRTALFNKIRGLSKDTNLAPKDQYTGVGTAPKDSEKEDKAKAREAKQVRQQQYKNALAEAKNRLQERLNELENKEFEISREINGLQYKSLEIAKQEDDLIRKNKREERFLDLEESKLDALKETGKISEINYLIQKKAIDDKKIENKFIQDTEELNLKIQEQKIKEEKLNKQKIVDLSAVKKIEQEIKALDEEKAITQSQLLTEKDPSKRIELEKTLAGYETKRNELIQKQAQAQAKALDSYNIGLKEIGDTVEKLNKDKLDLVDEKNLALDKGEIKFSIDAENANKEIFKTLIDGGKEIGGLLVDAFQKGKLSIQEAFKLAENIFSKIGNMFSSIGKMGGGTSSISSGASVLGGIVGFVSKLFGGGGGSSSFDPANPIGIPMKNGKPMAGYEQQYSAMSQVASSASGAGGLLSSLMGAGGAGAMSANPIGAVFTGLSMVAGLGGTLMGMFGASKAKKREKQMQATQMALQGSMVDIQDALDTLSSRLTKSTEMYEDFAEATNKAISKMDLSSSIFNIGKAIKKTNKLIKRTEEERKKVAKIYDEQIAEMQEELEGFKKVSKKRGGSAGKDTAKQGIADIKAKIKEVQEQKRQALKDLKDEIEGYEDTIEEYIKSQKELVKAFEDQYQKAIYKAKYGNAAGDLYDDLVAFQEEAWKLMQGGFDTDKTLYLLQSQAFELQNKIKDDLEDAVNNFADEILGLNQKLLGVIGEGKITGRVQQTQQDKIKAIQEKITRTREKANKELGNEFGNLASGIDNASTAIEAFTNQLYNSIQNIANAVIAGKDSLSDITVNITDPSKIAEAVLNKMKVSNWLTNAQI